MRLILVVVLLACASVQLGNAQTAEPKTSVPTPRNQGPFSSDWAKPQAETGGYFYNDPRLQNTQPTRPRGQALCPPGRLFNPSTGLCQ
jgi:hypothetical protein